MQRRNLLPLLRFRSSEPDERGDEIWPPRPTLARLAGRLIVGVMVIAGSAMIFAPALSEPQEQGLKAHDAGPLVGHIQHVQVGAFSPDGKKLATCGLDNSVRLWDASDLTGPPASAPVTLADDTIKYCAAFSADGSMLGAVGPRTLTIWNINSGQYRLVTRTPTESSSCLAFSPDGRTLAIGHDSGAVTLHDMPGAQERTVLYGHSNAVRSLSFSPDGRSLVSAGQDSLVMSWDTIKGVSVRSLLKAAINPIHVVAYSPDGGSVAVGEIGGRPTDVLVIDAGTGVVRTRLTGHAQGVCALAFSPDGSTLATAGADHSVKLWNLSDGKEKSTLTNDVGSISSLSISHDGAWLAFAGDGVAIKAWDSRHPRSPRLGLVRLPDTDGMAVTIDGSYGEPTTSGLNLVPVRLPRTPAASTL
jgi:WD40 repeat protein